MNRCPITYELCETKYSQAGLKLLSRDLNDLHDFPYTAQEQIEMAARFESKMSLQGVQPKLSTKLNAKKQIFEIVERGGYYIFKPPHNLFEEVPQNEDLSMKLASLVGIEVPVHGMLYNIDQSLSYFIERFDRFHGRKLAVEDFSQLMGYSRETKYESSMEKIVATIENHCTFPQLEKIKLFKLVIFNYLIGNEDMHLKNYSIIRDKGKVSLSPAYDLLNTTLIINADDEIALPLKGKKKRLNKVDLLGYFGEERLKLSPLVVEKELLTFEQNLPGWRALIASSFLSPDMQASYLNLVETRWQKLC